MNANICPTVLIVEDEPIIRSILGEFLREDGLQVIELASADEGLEYLREHVGGINLVLTDIHMPGRIDGAQLTQIVAHDWPDIALVVTSGRPSRDIELPDTALFLSKPWTLDRILDTTHRALEKAA